MDAAGGRRRLLCKASPRGSPATHRRPGVATARIGRSGLREIDPHQLMKILTNKGKEARLTGISVSLDVDNGLPSHPVADGQVRDEADKTLIVPIA